MNVKVDSRPLNDQERFLDQWAAESLRSNISTANATLSQLLTLSTALTGSGVYFLNDKVLPSWALTSTLIGLFVSLIACMIANLPYRKVVDISDAQEFEMHKKSTLENKLFKIKLCAFLISFSLLIAGTGVITKSITPATHSTQPLQYRADTDQPTDAEAARPARICNDPLNSCPGVTFP